MESESTSSPASPDGNVSRRGFLQSTSNIAMAGGLVAGYGTFFAIAGRYLYPSKSGNAWFVVKPIDEIEPGGSTNFTSSTGEGVVIRRSAESNSDDPAKEFLALSDVCPHLGCRVHWESNNIRFFCPCHNGVFDPEGKATEGPPAAEGQSLPAFPLLVENGLLYIEMPAKKLGVPS